MSVPSPEMKPRRAMRYSQFAESAKLEASIRNNLKGLNFIP